MHDIPRCEAIPLPQDQVSFRVAGVERTRWHFGPSAPRPFLYPLLGPSGETLTRMGHPGAENHDHHRSVWFAHHKLLGIDFWSENTLAIIRQRFWYVYHDADDECGMAVELGWYDGHDPQPLVLQELVIFLRPLEGGEYTLDLQSTFRPLAEQIEFQQTNFGFLAVRVAKSLSAHFGGGRLTGASGEQGEPALFGKSNVWMDYSGPVAKQNGDGTRTVVTEGITYFDHPANPHFPAKWHVRDDGWMGVSACRDAPLVATRENPLILRYLLHVHQGELNSHRADGIAADWATWPGYRVVKSPEPHRQYAIERTMGVSTRP